MAHAIALRAITKATSECPAITTMSDASMQTTLITADQEMRLSRLVTSCHFRRSRV